MSRYSSEATEQRRIKNFDFWRNSATLKHADRFDYSLAKDSFSTQRAPVVLVCKKHELRFETTAFNHLRLDGGGCTLCGKEIKAAAKRRDGEATFLSKFNERLSATLELKSVYLGMHQSITVRCKIHQTTKISTPNSLAHSDGYGCDECAKISQIAGLRTSLQTIQDRFAPLLPCHVNIKSIIQETGKATRALINCESHGESTVLIGYLTRSSQGRGYFCPKCGDEQNGYAGYRLKRLIANNETGKATWIAAMEVEPFGIRTLKVGISTRSLIERYGASLKVLHFTARLPEREALLIENEVHRTFKSKSDMRIQRAGMRNGKRWSGDTECYWLEAKDEIVDFLKQRLGNLEAGIFNISEALDAFVEPDITIRNVSESRHQRMRSEEVVCLETGQVFESIQKAATAVDGSSSNIASVLKGLRRTASGKRWVFAKDYDPAAPIPQLRAKKVTTLKVLCVEDNRIFGSLTDAGNAYGISSSHITSVCRGTRKSAGGKTWRYVE